MKIPLQQTARAALFAIEIAILTALILATRCANYQEVFAGGNIYFIDADCYARMTRVRMCEQLREMAISLKSSERHPFLAP